MNTRTRSPGLSGGRSGQSLVFTVVMLLGILVVLALAIDLGMLFTARAEAQRAADAAALAGASAFQEMKPDEAVVPARTRAYALAEENHIRNKLIRQSEVTVDVKPDSELVRVWVRRDSLPTWFARLIGIDYAPVGAKAAARALPGGSATCLKPFAIPDIWNDPEQDTADPYPGNRTWDPGEEWTYDTGAGDQYGVNGGDTYPMTGYGSAWRDDRLDASGHTYREDFGRPLTLKSQSPQDEFVIEPGLFLPWRLPLDPNQAECSKGGGGGGGGGGNGGQGGGGGTSGGAVYRQNICTCNMTSIDLNHPYDLEPGDMVGPTAQGINDLISQDPDAEWQDGVGGEDGKVVKSIAGKNWQDSPRVIKLALFEPGQVTKGGMQSIEFNSFAWFFVEKPDNQKSPVVGRFIGRLPGDGKTKGPTSDLIRVIRLVE